jgi:peptidoglycan/LPS O-acetylase OafA/YrhL
LIIQLYFALPILFWLLRKSGIAWFSAITVAVTLLARYWMLYHERSNLAGYMLIGGVFVSRLAEFSLGMAFASLAHEKGTHVLHAIGSNSATLLGAALYIGGTLCYSANSTYIFVDLLCTAGMVLLSARVAMFLCWIAPVRKALTFAGSVSLSTFLLHQPWAISIGLALHKQPAWLFGLCSAIAIPVLIAISWICERAVNWVVDLVRRTDRRPAAATPEAA